MTQQKTEEQKGPTTEERVAKSRSDREAASLRKDLKAAQEQLSVVERERDEHASTTKLLKEQMGWGEDEEKRTREFVQRESKLAKLEKDIAVKAKELAARQLSLQYGIPESDLMEYDNADSMRIAALELALEASRKGNGAKPKEEEKEEPTPKMDTGAGSRTAVNWNAPHLSLNTEEGRKAFEKQSAEYEAQQKRNRRVS